jgi:hypothetical protein
VSGLFSFLLYPPEIFEIVDDQSSGATPELARGTRALPIPASEFGLKLGATGCQIVNRQHRSARAESQIENEKWWLFQIMSELWCVD